jgi:hypothetical protein
MTMHEQNLDYVADVLRERVGNRFASAEIDGRGELARALCDGLNVDNAEAERLIAALIEGGKLRYRSPSEAASDDVDNSGVVSGGTPIVAIPTPGISSGGGAPTVPVALMETGFWELTDANSTVRPSTTRKGQVEPSGL